MKKYLILIVCALAVVLITACEGNDPQTTETSSSSNSTTSKYLRVTPSELTFRGFHMQSQYIQLESNTNWNINIENKAMFQTVTPSNYGSGDARISVTVPAISSNQQNSFTTQKGKITISCKDEKGKTISYTVECERRKSY